MDDEDALRILSNIEDIFTEDLMEILAERTQARHKAIAQYLYLQRKTDKGKPVDRKFASKKQLEHIDEWWKRLYE